MKIAFVGGKTSVIGFGALGLDTFTVARPDDARGVWERIDLSNYALVLVTEPVYRVLKEEVEDARQQRMPVISVVPSVAVSEGVGLEELRLLVERAVGSDVMFRD